MINIENAYNHKKTSTYSRDDHRRSFLETRQEKLRSPNRHTLVLKGKWTEFCNLYMEKLETQDITSVGT